MGIEKMSSSDDFDQSSTNYIELTDKNTLQRSY